MNAPFVHTVRTLLCAALIPAAAWASPGAHGPNGEHLDGPAAVVAGSASPMVTAHSDVLELVARLQGQALVIDLGRFDTNEPIAQASIDVELGSLKASAQWRAAEGDYVVSDAALLKALQAEGEHALVFTIQAGDISDLLDGVMATAHDHAHEAGHEATAGTARASAWTRSALGLAGGATLVAVGGAFWWRRRQRSPLSIGFKEVR